MLSVICSPVNEDLRLFCLSLLNWLVVFVLLNANST